MICSQHPDHVYPHSDRYGQPAWDCPGPGVDVWEWIRQAQAENARLKADADDARERYVALEGELLGCQDATQALRAENARLVSGAFDLNLQLAELREQVEVGAKMLAHQCDLAREAETRAAHAFGCERDAQDECIALEAQLAAVTRELEKMKLEKQKLSDIVMTVCDERDAAQVLAEDHFRNTDAALDRLDVSQEKCRTLQEENARLTQERNTLMERWKTHSCALDTIVQELRERIKVLTKELTLHRRSHRTTSRTPTRGKN